MFAKYLHLLISLPKTLIFNFYYFPFLTALRLPIFVSHRVWLCKLGGQIQLPRTGVRTGFIRIGFGEIGIFDSQRSRSVFRLMGRLEFEGAAHIGHGCKLAIAGTLCIGSNFIMTAESSIIVLKQISIGHDVLISWDCLIMDTDFHSLLDVHQKRINLDSPVKIGDHVWIGCRCLILKGVSIADGVVIAASTTVTKSCFQEKTLVGGNPVQILRDSVEWSH